jgi:1-deoxy-D-xylulose-5-phosphate synthase
MLSVPGMTVAAPKDGEELVALLRLALEHDAGPFCIRYPRDNVPAAPGPLEEIPPLEYGRWELLREGRDLAILATGTMVLPALAAAEILAREGVLVSVVNARFIKPLDESLLERLFPAHRAVLTVEEGTVVNGFGAFVRSRIHERWPGVRGRSMGLPDEFVEHGERSDLLRHLGLTPEGIVESVRSLLGTASPQALRETA